MVWRSGGLGDVSLMPCRRLVNIWTHDSKGQTQQVDRPPDSMSAYVRKVLARWGNYMSKSFMAFHIKSKVMPWRLCISDFEGSSRRMRLTMISRHCQQMSRCYRDQQSSGGRTFLPLSEPPFGSKPSFSLSRGWCHGKARPNSNRKRKDTFLFIVSQL